MKKSDLILSALNQRVWILQLALPVFFLLGLGSGWLMWGNKSAAAQPPAAAVEPTADPNQRYDVPIADAPSHGPENAPVTIVEFSDYQCPFCVRWYNEVYTRLMAEYKDQVRFVYQDFPLTSIHPDAQPAAEAAHCAGEQDAYWKFHDALFSEKYSLGAQAYQQYATDMGLDMAAFNACVTERRHKAKVENGINVAFGVNVRSTPTFFINGRMVVGAQPYEVFKQRIDAELAGVTK
jgi:protein-disulfide isomerase